ncbi:MAG TPA: YhdB family protein [Bacillota bacterium]|nr:YhdB family protein [Bacillota bacterium]
MNIPDYDKALYYTLWGQWDDLLVLMVRTSDDILCKRIEHFLHAYHYADHEDEVLKHHTHLLYYVEHAMKQIDTETLQL